MPFLVLSLPIRNRPDADFVVESFARSTKHGHFRLGYSSRPIWFYERLSLPGVACQQGYLRIDGDKLHAVLQLRPFSFAALLAVLAGIPLLVASLGFPIPLIAGAALIYVAVGVNLYLSARSFRRRITSLAKLSDSFQPAFRAKQDRESEAWHLLLDAIRLD